MKILLKLFFMWPLYFLSGFMKKDKKIWCFGSYRNKFNDNSKYAYIKCSRLYDDLKCYWVTDDEGLILKLEKMGLRAVKRRSLKGLYITSRASVCFISSYVTDIFFWTTRKSLLVNLWHGMPLKKIEYDIDSGPLFKKYHAKGMFDKIKYRILEPECFRKPDFMFAPSEFWASILSKAFSVDQKKFIYSGAPRTDIFFDDFISFEDLVYENKKFKKELEFSRQKKILLMPTFRDNGDDYFTVSKIDLNRLSKWLTKNNAVLYVKLHPSDKSSSELKSGFDNIVSVDVSVSDIYPYLKYFDLLITDYSSIYLDFILLNKEVVFFSFDLDKYISQSRSMYFDYESFTPGRKAYCFNELIDVLDGDVRSDRDDFVSQYFFYGSEVLVSSDSIYNKIKECVS